jgi:hypothetical protein
MKCMNCGCGLTIDTSEEFFGEPLHTSTYFSCYPGTNTVAAFEPADLARLAAKFSVLAFNEAHV